MYVSKTNSKAQMMPGLQEWFCLNA